MNHRVWLVLAGAFLLIGREARAHFLFIHITPPAEAGRAAEVYFSEIAQAGDPTFIDKVAHTQLWMQKTPGEFVPLTVRRGADRLRAYLPATKDVSVVGACEYGVIARPNQTPFLLRYYPKAMAGNPDELNLLTARPDTPLEIVATASDDRLSLVALRNGKPLPGVTFTTVDVDLANEELSADSDGRATWRPPHEGRFSVYMRYVTKESGEEGGKKYAEIREFATLAFTWPLVRRGPDPEAVTLFEEAINVRAQWKNFPGFKAHITGEVDGRPFNGTVAVNANGDVKLDTNEPITDPWVQDQLVSIATHRGASSSDGSNSNRQRPVLRFADDQGTHPLGRLLILYGGTFASSYRVKDKQIVVVNRHLGKQNMTITVLDNDRNVDGKFLPRSYTVQYWNSATGNLLRTETIQDRWQRIGSWDLPVSHTVTTASESGLSARTFTLSKHELTEK